MNNIKHIVIAGTSFNLLLLALAVFNITQENIFSGIVQISTAVICSLINIHTYRQHKKRQVQRKQNEESEKSDKNS